MLGGKGHIRVAYLNIQPLSKGVEEDSSLISDFEFDILGVTETSLQQYTPSVGYMIPGYSLIRRDRYSGEQITPCRKVGECMALVLSLFVTLYNGRVGGGVKRCLCGLQATTSEVLLAVSTVSLSLRYFGYIKRNNIVSPTLEKM